MSGIPYKCGETMNFGVRERDDGQKSRSGKTPAAAPEGKELREKPRKALPRHFLLDTSTGTLALDFEIPEPLEEIEELL